MLIDLKNGKQVILKQVEYEDFNLLLLYLLKLSDNTKKRFGPHDFDLDTIQKNFSTTKDYKGYIAIDTESNTVVAYSIIKFGYLDFEVQRLQHYSIVSNENMDCTFAPSVADEWQGLGIGNAVFEYLRSDLKKIGIRHIILWGGVQASNVKAVNFYQKFGFRVLGEFEYNGLNLDMVLQIN